MQLARFWRWAVRHRYARTNFLEMIEVPKKWREEVRIANQTTGQALTLEEARKLLDACEKTFTVDITWRKFRPYREDKTDDRQPPSYLRLFVIIALRTGLRVSNIIPLRDSRKKSDVEEEREPLKPGLLWRHIDLKEKMIRIEPELMKNGLPFVVPMHNELAEVLDGLRKSLGRVPRPEEPVIPEPPMELKESFHGAMKRAGLADRGFRIHDLRHTWASWCGRYCVEAAKKRLGGWAASTVHDRYSQHQEVAFLREELNKMPRLLGPVDATVQRAEKRSGT
jgi:integrase